jgi:diaminohydroxyphosphoribosylaminopyrimidine deaminase/5-amino-6-(5-phosphoribosylamino)uracil reductase
LTEVANLSNLENLLFEQIEFDDRLAYSALTVLAKHNILSVIIEGGRQTLQTFIDAGLWDEARIFKGQVNFKSGTPSPKISGTVVLGESILKDELQILRNYDQHDNI